MARLEAVRAVCVGVADKMAAVVSAGEERVRDLERRGEVAVDEVVCSVSIVHNQ
jgi:ESCRT-I complex subunit TSG101